MKDKDEAAQAEGEAVPAKNLNADRAIAAVERWYAAHFHRAAVHGYAAIPSDDKAALIQHVVAAVSTKE